jgi:Fe-S-cluster-containing hydrogenase component 2
LPLLSGKVGQPVGKAGQLVVKPGRCTGCRTCELACSFCHTNGGQLGKSRISIHNVGKERYIQLTCLQCLDAACVKACPANALRRNEHTGAIEIKTLRCVGCGLCEAACPFGHMHFDSSIKLPIKCDLCAGRPTCAAFCPHNALEVR